MRLSGSSVASAAGLLTIFVCLASPPPATGQSELPANYIGPPAPILPATIARDGEGHVTVRAIRVTTPLRIDGALDEAVYSSASPMSDFVQAEPRSGEPGTEKTEMW